MLVSNEPYINKCLQSIKEIKEIGNWKDDIVLLVSEKLYANNQLINIAKNNNIILRKVPNRSFKKQMDFLLKLGLMMGKQVHLPIIWLKLDGLE